MAELAIRLQDNGGRDERLNKSSASAEQGDVKIIWKGKKIAKVIFASGKEVTFEE